MMALAFLATTLASGGPARAATGEVDTTFSGDGELVALNPEAADPQGRLLSLFGAHPTPTTFLVRRMTTAGVPDPTFSGNGRVAVSFGGPYMSSGRAIAASADSIYLLGTDGRPSPRIRVAVARLTNAGTIDRSFSGTGAVTVDLGDFGLGGGIAHHSQQPLLDGGLGFVASLARFSDAEASWKAVRLASGGGRSSQLSGDGILPLPSSTIDATFTPAGRIYAVLDPPALPSGSFTLVRYAKSGALDTTFAGDGQVRFKGCSSDARPGVRVDVNGRAVVSCERRGNPQQVLIQRFTAAGLPDPTFSVDGTTVVTGCCFVEIDALGRIVAVRGGEDSLVVRLNRSGEFDRGFSGDGRATLVGVRAGGTHPPVLFHPHRIYLTSGTSTVAVEA